MFTRFFLTALMLGAVAATAQSNPSFQLKRLPQPQTFGVLATASGDFNNDGKPDFVEVNQTPTSQGLTTFLGNGDGTFPTTKFSSGIDQPQDIAVADFDRDGKLDILTVTFNQTFQVSYGNGDGTFQPPLTFPTAAPARTISFGDFNGDGLPDVVIGELNGYVEAF